MLLVRKQADILNMREALYTFKQVEIGIAEETHDRK